MQEGWHYELENKDAPLTYNGVVYNEMKGALSSPEAIMEDRAMEKLFPNTTYGVESGGDPEVIPTLSFREFTEFHRRFIIHPTAIFTSTAIWILKRRWTIWTGNTCLLSIKEMWILWLKPRLPSVKGYLSPLPTALRK